MTKIKKILAKDHRPYFLILFFSFIFLITFYSLNFPQKEPIVSLISPTPTSRPTNKPIPTTTKGTPQPLKNIDNTYPVGARKIEVKYDSKTKITSLFLTENGQNILINSFKSSELSDGNTYRNIPINFSISSDNNYLSYTIASEWEGSISEFYYIPDKKITHLKLSIDDSGFSKDNEYFYACSLDGMPNGGAFIYKLPEMSLVYQDKNSNAKCQYDSSDNSLKISYTDQNKPFFTNTIYYFDTTKAVSQ